jgi:hypothetical protein
VREKKSQLAVRESDLKPQDRIHLQSTLAGYDQELTQQYHASPFFRMSSLPIITVPRESLLYHLSLKRFSKDLKPNLFQNYFLPVHKDMTFSLQYLLLWKFTARPETRHRVWWLNVFQTKTRLKLLRLGPSFNLQDAALRLGVKEGKEKTTTLEKEIDSFICRNMLSQVDGIWRQGETAVVTIPEIGLCKSTVATKLQFVEAQPVDDFFKHVTIKNLFA